MSKSSLQQLTGVLPSLLVAEQQGSQSTDVFIVSGPVRVHFVSFVARFNLGYTVLMDGADQKMSLGRFTVGGQTFQANLGTGGLVFETDVRLQYSSASVGFNNATKH